METTVIILISDVSDTNTERMKHRYFLIDFFYDKPLLPRVFRLVNLGPTGLQCRRVVNLMTKMYGRVIERYSLHELVSFVSFSSVLRCVLLNASWIECPSVMLLNSTSIFHVISLKWNLFFSTFCLFITGRRNGCRGMFQIAAHKSMQELTLSIGNGKMSQTLLLLYRWYSNVAQQLTINQKTKDIKQTNSGLNLTRPPGSKFTRVMIQLMQAM